jgi:hypothetical protein
MTNTKQTFTVALGLMLVFTGSLAYALATDNPRIQLLAVSLGCASPLLLITLRKATATKYGVLRTMSGVVAAGLIGISTIGLYNSGAFEVGSRSSALLTITILGTLFVVFGSRTGQHRASAA